MSFKSSGAGFVRYGGNSVPFDKRASLKFESWEIPVTCLVEIDGKRGVFQVYGSGSVTCNAAGDEVTCDPAMVR